MAHCLQRAITKAKLSGRQFFDQIPINRTYFYNVLANDRHDLTDMVKRSYAVGRKTKNDVFIAAVKEMAEFVKEYCALKLFKGKKKMTNRNSFTSSIYRRRERCGLLIGDGRRTKQSLLRPTPDVSLASKNSSLTTAQK